MRRRTTAVIVLAALSWVLLSGCLDQSPASKRDDRPGDGGSTEVGATSTRTAGSVPEPLVEGLEFEVSHGSAVAQYDVLGPRVKVQLAVGPTPESLRVLDGPESAGRQTIRIGFLQGDTAYQYVLTATDGFRTQRLAGAFRTQPDPYAWAEGEVHVQPGMRITSGSSGCTSAFVVRGWDNQTLYLTTAGHCVDEVGAVVEGPEGPVGKVVAFENRGAGFDWALIRIDDAERPFVSPRLLHWTGPIGVANATNLEAGTTVCHHGYGVVLGDVPQTRARCGEFGGFEGGSSYGQTFWFKGRGVSGDSGSAVIDHSTGRAVGVLTHLGVGEGTVNTGTPMERVLEIAQDRGFDVGLAVIDYAQQPASPI